MSDLGSAALGSAVSGGLGLIGSGLSYVFNKKLAEQQNQYNIDMWKMQADYNSPQSQMQRYADAGLNPNLIYSQGSNGNMSQAPQMVTPQAPELSKDMQKLGEAFNIENLRTIVANRKKAQEEARIAELERFDKEDYRDAFTRLGHLYSYDDKSGKYKLYTPDQLETSAFTAPNPRGSRIGDSFNGSAYLLNMLVDNARKAALFPSVEALNVSRKNFLQPQIHMMNYESRYQPWSYWIGNGTKVLNSIGNLIPRMKLQFGGSRGSSYPRYSNYNY